MSRKPYKAKTLMGAQKRVRELVNLNRNITRLLELYAAEWKLLAKLAATGQAFNDPLEAALAKQVRDKALRTMGLNPDGSYIK